MDALNAITELIFSDAVKEVNAWRSVGASVIMKGVTEGNNPWFMKFTRDKYFAAAPALTTQGISAEMYQKEFEEAKKIASINQMKEDIIRLTKESLKTGYNPYEHINILQSLGSGIKDMYRIFAFADATKFGENDVLRPIIKEAKMNKVENHLYNVLTPMYETFEEEKATLLEKLGDEFILLIPKEGGHNGYKQFTKEEVEELSSKREEIMKRKEQRLNALKEGFEALANVFDSITINTLKLVSLYSYYLDFRRGYVSILYMHMWKFIDNVKVPTDLWMFEELIEYLKTGRKPKPPNERYLLGYTEIPREEGEKIFNMVFKQKHREVKELRGLPASKGKVRGKAVVYTNPSKPFEGDILVTYYTNPEYVPAMKKAKGIITEYGGITSHAAVVSREFGIPCIVDVENAVSLLDGKFVELDADKGIVKILDE